MTYIILFLIWAISIIISSPIIYLGYVDKANVMDLEVKRCALNNEKFRLYGSFFSFVIPLIVMILMFTLMVRKLRMQLSKIDNSLHEDQKEQFETLRDSPKKSISNTISTTTASTPTTNDTNISSSIKTSKNHPKIVFNSKIKMSKIESVNSKDSDMIQDSTMTNYDHLSQNSIESNSGLRKKNMLNDAGAPCNNNIKKYNKKSKLKETQIKSQLRRHTARTIIKRPSFNLSRSSSFSNQSNKNMTKKIVKKRYDLYASTSENSIKAIKARNNLKNNYSHSLQSSHTEVQNEAKALQVLGIVFIAFIIAWLPFCFINMLSSILEINGIRFAKFYDYIIYFTYLGYFQSTFNPIIYTVFNRKFRTNFLEIIKCKNRNNFKKSRYLNTYR